MLDLNKSYEARFLGRQVLTGAVTSDLLCHLVHDLPESVQGGTRCTVQCNASGLTVNRAVSTGTGITSLKVPLRDILFCHVDKARPEVTVWVVRSKDEDQIDNLAVGAASATGQHRTPTTNHQATGSGQHVLQAYIYRCLNQNDAVGLFKVYNEINRQAKLEKYRRNGEKKEESGSTDGPSTIGNHVHYKVPRSTSNFVSSIDFSDDSEEELHLVPAVIVLSPTVKSEVKKMNAGTAQVNGKVGSVPPRTRPERDLGSVSITTTGNGHAEVHNGSSSPTWTSIVGNIANYRKSFRILRPRDKQVREAMLEELREKLRSRNVDGETENDHALSNSNGKPTDGGGARNPGNRQRKPVRIISAPDSEDNRGKTNPSMKSLQNPVFVATSPSNMIATSPASQKSGSFHFPWSSAVKKLVNKKRNNGLMITSTFRPIPFPPHHNTMWVNNVPSKELSTKTSASSKGKRSPKKGPAPLPPPPSSSTNSSNSQHRGKDPYFYLPPLPTPSHDATKPATNGQHSRSDNFIPIHSNTLSHTRLRSSSGSAAEPVESGKPRRTTGRVIPVTTESFRVLEPGMSDEAKLLSYPTPHYFHGKANGYPQNNSFFNGYGHAGSKKKPHVLYGLSRSSRTNNVKKRNPSNGNSTFYRTSSTGSHGSTSSDSGPDNKLRSVMKKPRQTNDNSPPEQKKNVTFHAYATVQVLT